MKIHHRNIRLQINAGMSFPDCYAQATMLDTDKGRLPSVNDWNKVTCKHCLKNKPRDTSHLPLPSPIEGAIRTMVKMTIGNLLNR